MADSLKAQKRYYMIGRRPLDNAVLKKAFNVNNVESNINFEHRQFIANDGKNFGLSKDINNKYGNILEEGADKLNEYSYDIKKFQTKKYDANCIDAAREELEKEWRSRIDNVDRVPPFSGFPEKVVDLLPYNIAAYNCQDFVDHILSRAEKFAKKKGVPLVIQDEPKHPSDDNAKGAAEQYGEVLAEDWGKILYPNMN